MKKTHQSLPSDENINRMVEIFKALSDPTRLKIVLSLLNREHCVCDIAVLCGQSDSAVSHQLRILRTLKIVKNRREGKIMYYSINDDHVVSLIQMSLAHVTHG
ncbi:MAG TPA: metalloregulator ArsR/SmtB family transcription factor [Desulfotignum sp.]|nr:metalloregulator ArsR/SmtB family transcription factor [Desulfotignum sp.]